jgi:hypothetical protein
VSPEPRKEPVAELLQDRDVAREDLSGQQALEEVVVAAVAVAA